MIVKEEEVFFQLMQYGKSQVSSLNIGYSMFAVEYISHTRMVLTLNFCPFSLVILPSIMCQGLETNKTSFSSKQIFRPGCQKILHVLEAIVNRILDLF